MDTFVALPPTATKTNLTIAFALSDGDPQPIYPRIADWEADSEQRLDLLYVSEATVHNTWPDLEDLMRPGVVEVSLLAGWLQWLPAPEGGEQAAGAHLAALATGTCFLTADNEKVALASFARESASTDFILLETKRVPGLVDLLRAETCTVEISGTNHRKLDCPLDFQLTLQLALHYEPVPARRPLHKLPPAGISQQTSLQRSWV